MKQFQPIINGEIETYKKEHSSHNAGQISKQTLTNNSNSTDDCDKINRSPAKISHQPSNSISNNSIQFLKNKSQTSKSFHSSNMTPSQTSFSAQKTQAQGSDKNSTIFNGQKYMSQVIVNGFSDVKLQQYNNFNTVTKDVQSVNHIASNTSFSASNETFKVYARVRPINAKEKSQSNPKKRMEITKAYENTIYILDPEPSRGQENSREKSFSFDTVFGEKDDNQKVYEGTIAYLIKDHLLEGYNTTVFAYGQTGAGKTFTLFGDEYKNQEFIEGRDIMSKGIVSLIIKDLFAIFQKQKDFKFSLKVSYLEIYNENIRDLLVEQDKQSNLMIVEDPTKGILIPELSEYLINDSSELNNLIRKGNSIRVMASTQSNQFSSRSHCIIQINIEKTHVDIKQSSQKIISKLSLIDLAGSERAAVSDNKGIRMMEGSKINRSLLALGNCINILSDSKKQGAYIPYRDSKLTRLLKDSLGGTTKTVMIACIAPSYLTYEETINTLKYAQRAKFIQNKIKQNVIEQDIHATQYKQIIDNLKLEIESLKKQLHTQSKKEPNQIIQKTDIANLDQNSIKEIENEDDENIEELSQQIFLNIEENWEITQTLRDLESLRKKNDEMLQTKQEEQRLLMKTTISSQNDEEIMKLEQEIQMIMMNMQNNDTIFQDLLGNLEKNNQEKKILREKIRQIIESSENGQEKTLEETCRLLQLEKMDLCSQNFEIKKEAQTLAREKEQTVSKLKQMEKEMELMKQQLQEKDKIISKSSLIINKLKQKEYQQTSKKVSSSTINQIASSPQPQPQSSTAIQNPQTRKIREKSISSVNNQESKLASQANQQTSFNAQERSPKYSNVQQDVYYKPYQQNRQLSTNRQEQSKKKIQQHSNNFSQTNIKLRQQNFATESVNNNTHSVNTLKKVKQPTSQNNGSQLGFQSVKNPSNQPTNNNGEMAEDIKKEYYYFDSNKKLQKRVADINDNQKVIQNDKDQQIQNDKIQQFKDKILQSSDKTKVESTQNMIQGKREFKLKLDGQSTQQAVVQNNNNNNNNNNNIKPSPTKQNKGLKIDLESLKKFDEIQKNKQEKKVNENQVVKNNNNQQQEGIIPSNKQQKQKKKSKHKQNLLDEKINIDDLKNYAQKLKDVDFQNIKIKPNLKKFQKNNDINANQNSQMKDDEDNINGDNSQQQFNQDEQQTPQNQFQPQKQKNNNEFNIYSQQNFAETLSSQRKNVNQQLDSKKEVLPSQKEIIENHANKKETQGFKQGQDYEQEINNIQEKIVEAQQLISNIKQQNNQTTQLDPSQVVNQFQQKNQQIFEEYSNIDKLNAQKLSYYSKGNGVVLQKEKSLDFENYLQQMKMEQQIKESGDQSLIAINDISLMNKVADNSIDQTLQDFIYNFEKIDNPENINLKSSVNPKINGKNQISSNKQNNAVTTPDKNNKINLKSLDEARVKIRSFKHQMNTLNDKIKGSQVNPDMINQMKNLLKQYDSEQYSLSTADQNIIKEFKRILVIFKEYDVKKSNNLNPLKHSQNLTSSANPSAVNFATAQNNSSQTPSHNQHTTRPRSINSETEEATLHTQYYQSNFNNNLGKKDTNHQSGQYHSSHYHQPQSTNISVNKKQIEQGAFSKISNNYGEAAKVINSSSQSTQNNSSTLKKYNTNKTNIGSGENQDSSRRTVKQIAATEMKITKKQPNEETHKQIQQQKNDQSNPEGTTPASLLTQLLNQNDNSKNIYENLIKNNEMNKNNQSGSLASSQIYQTNFNMNNTINNNNNPNSSTNRGKSVTSYVQINNKRKSFKEDSDKSYQINNNININLNNNQMSNPNNYYKQDQYNKPISSNGQFDSEPQNEDNL